MTLWQIVQDAVWLALFGIIAFTGPEHDPRFIFFLFLLAVFQVVERKIPQLTSRRGSVGSNLFKLALGFLILWESGGDIGGITSSYYWVLLIPVVSAATTLGVAGTVIFTALACATYLSFLIGVDWERYVIPADQVSELSLRLISLVVIGYLTQRLAEATRQEARRAQAVADQLAEANKSLQEAEAAMRRSERLAALGQLSGGLAHELRNPLGTMRASAEMLVKNVAAENEIAHELAGFISSEVDRVNSLVTRFLEFARPFETKLQVAELSESIDRAVAQVERDGARFQVSIYKNYSPEVKPFEFDPELVERVFYNLLMNAMQASPAGGTVTIKSRRVDGFVEIAVIDRGSGIDQAQLENVFNPFFTTKKDGVGLGLAIVTKIVDLHGGKMAVESEAGKGSVFRVLLPFM